MNDSVFRRLSKDEVDLGYEIYLAAFKWLNANGIRQWLVPLRLSDYEAREKSEENYGLFISDELAVIASLAQKIPHEWADVVSEPQTWWIQTLAASQKFRGKNLGKLTMQFVETYLAKQNVQKLYLDCVDVAGFLPVFYSNLGFVKIEQRNITYPSGNTFPMVLMKKDLYLQHS
ncbi:MAG: GNAT family N-acetyltransferase [Limisphaerales bacterium]